MQGEEVNREIEKAQKENKSLLLIFSGDDCKWCKKLKELLKDNLLQTFCVEDNINLTWITLEPKAKDVDNPNNLRRRFSIKSIPTAVLFDSSGTLVATTEFIDAVQEQGGNAYIQWVQNNQLF